ncbi:MAG: FKBP-type peptidyl-prolyl cis-trans isomerase [Pseudoflavonifractor sp.]|nr:FKBP-type peptidyl-prolyl cis-trans isomerase [Alloprevotella sp.]MCM1117069.1 FKBP-type peptidyl-prolyl cis-trans isomerase [Pseudoflavonifractor sp.]
MKKILLAAAAAVALISGTACSGSSASSSNGSDSLTVTFGKFQGASYNQMFENIPQEDKAKFTKDGFLRGFKQAVLADTTDAAYVQGLMAGAQLWQQFVMWREQEVGDPNVETFYNEFADYFKRDSISMTEMADLQAQMQTLFNAVTARLTAKRDSAMAAERAKIQGPATEHKAKATAFIDSIKAADPDVKFTPSGLGYKVVKQGKGDTFGANDNVDVIYTGTLIDGTQFDSSNGKTVNFNVGGVVPGFAEGLQLMNPGSKYILYIPSDLGYGDNGNPAVPGGAMMVFEVETPAK